MSHKHKHGHHHERISKSREWMKTHKDTDRDSSARDAKPKLELVLKCDSAGSIEAAAAAILNIANDGIDINIINSGVGNINHSDILMAKTGSRLIAGFQVNVLPGIEKELDEHNVEVRLYDVIYALTADIGNITQSIAPHIPEEEITGTAKVITLFKSVRKGIIIGCEVLEGQLSVHKHFRIISAMGPVYSGSIESMHIESASVQKASPGQQVGIKIQNFNKAKTGDIVECYRPVAAGKSKAWQSTGTVIRK
ncbi:MAG: hypothetical protein ABFR82_00085 [Nitrospirota bacterium]